VKRLLNEAVLKSLPYAPAGQIDIWDTALPRFGVRLGTRRKTFIINFSGTRKSLGTYPRVSLRDARNQARAILFGHPVPVASLKAHEAVDVYLREIAAERRPNTVSAYTIYLRRIPNEPLHTLVAKQLYGALPEKKGAANLCFNIFKAFLSWCVQRDYITVNPLIGRRQPNRLKSRDRLLTDDEVKAIWGETYKHEIGALLRALILSGQRLNQFAAFDLAWIADDRITWPGRMMKNGQEHSIPLLPLLKANLPGPTPRNITIQAQKVRDALSVPHWTPHDFRRFFSSTMASLGTPIDVTEALLAHVSGSRSQIQRVYDRHNRLPEMRLALEKYEAHIQRVVGST
jgi:integrase